MLQSKFLLLYHEHRSVSISLFGLLKQRYCRRGGLNIYFSQFWRPASPRSGYWQICCLMNASFLVLSPLYLLLFSINLDSHLLVLTWWNRWGNPLGLYKSISLIRAASLWSNHLLKSPPSNTIVFGIRISAFKIEGDTTFI